MIKRQYDYYGNKVEETYFTNFVDQVTQSPYTFPWMAINEALKPWKAELGKSKSRYRYNVKFHDEQLYTIFRLKFS